VLARFECARIILLSNEPIGLLKVARDGREWRLIQIQIVPEKQGLGLGGWIIQNLIAEVMEAGASLKFSVLKANPARHLYERLGFWVMNTNDYAYERQLGA
jgi:ribosomal protein S18 acetylase RimI-like enzyme